MKHPNLLEGGHEEVQEVGSKAQEGVVNDLEYPSAHQPAQEGTQGGYRRAREVDCGANAAQQEVETKQKLFKFDESYTFVIKSYFMRLHLRTLLYS